MNGDVKALWVEALRSGKYQQGTDYLHRLDDTYCCLGVLCDLAVQYGQVDEPVQYGEIAYKYGSDQFGNSILPEEVQKWAGLPSADPHVDESCLSALNDDGKSFNEIANLIQWGQSWE